MFVYFMENEQKISQKLEKDNKHNFLAKQKKVDHFRASTNKHEN